MHQQPDMSLWQGRTDHEEGELGRRWHQIVRPLQAHRPADKQAHSEGVALLGFACDAGVARNHGRTGAKDGPAAIRALLGNMPVQRCKAIVDAGDVICLSDDGNDGGDGLENAQQELSETVAALLGRSLHPIVMGGGHEIAFGSFGGLARHLAAKETAPRIGIVNLDAHFDLRMAERASSGTPFRQIAKDCRDRGWPFHYCCLGVSRFANTEALFERARALGVHWRLDEEMGILRLQQTLAAVNHFLAGVDHVYLTICLDVFPASVAPGVSAPAAHGVPVEVVEPIIDMIAASGKLRLADLAELNPRLDIDHRTARVAARLAARLAEHFAA